MSSKSKCHDCDLEVPNHLWGSIRAQNEGWFFQKDGTAYCPEHVPDWVAGWRDRQNKG